MGSYIEKVVQIKVINLGFDKYYAKKKTSLNLLNYYKIAVLKEICNFLAALYSRPYNAHQNKVDIIIKVDIR